MAEDRITNKHAAILRSWHRSAYAGELDWAKDAANEIDRLEAEIERLRALNEQMAIGLQDIGNLAGKGGIVNDVADPIGHLRAIHETATALTAARQEPS